MHLLPRHFRNALEVLKPLRKCAPTTKVTGQGVPDVKMKPGHGLHYRHVTPSRSSHALLRMIATRQPCRKAPPPTFGYACEVAETFEECMGTRSDEACRYLRLQPVLEPINTVHQHSSGSCPSHFWIRHDAVTALLHDSYAKSQTQTGLSDFSGSASRPLVACSGRKRRPLRDGALHPQAYQFNHASRLEKWLLLQSHPMCTETVQKLQ